jgi:hypothetical protein
MNKQEFNTQMQFLQDELFILNTAKQSLMDAYIEANKQFKVGELIEVVTPKVLHRQIVECRIIENVRGKEIVNQAFVAGWEISIGNNVVPILYKIKKDGTQSLHRYQLGANDTCRPLKKNVNL